jgi:hypothetical protein
VLKKKFKAKAKEAKRISTKASDASKQAKSLPRWKVYLRLDNLPKIIIPVDQFQPPPKDL